MYLEELSQLKGIIANLKTAISYSDKDRVYDLSAQANALYSDEVSGISEAFENMKKHSEVVFREAKVIVELLKRYSILAESRNEPPSDYKEVSSMTVNEYKQQIYKVMRVILAIPDANHQTVAQKCGISIEDLNNALDFLKRENLISGIAVAQAGRHSVYFYDKAKPTIEGLNFMQQFETDGTPHIQGPNRPSVFVSYNHKTGADFADSLEKEIQPCANVIRDKSSMGDWEPFSLFMKSIRDQDFAVLVITKEYMQSIACMFEVSEFMKEKNWRERVMFAVLDESIFSGGATDYIEYWQEEERKLNEKAKGIDPKNMETITQNLKKISAIQLCFGEFFTMVCDANNPKPWNIIKSVINRIKQKEINDFTGDLDNSVYAEEKAEQIRKALE